MSNQTNDNKGGSNAGGGNPLPVKPISQALFCRKILKPGIYTGNCKGRTIRIVGRGVYRPLNADEARFLNDDPEIVLFKQK